MAVSTADFYTYAKETGTPLAQSNEERAALYPAVNQWKRSRLNTPRPESNDTGALETAAVLGGIVGAGLLGRRYLKNRPPTATKTPDIVEKGGAGVRTDYTQPKTWDEVKQKQTPKYKTTEIVEKPVDSRGVQTVDIEVVQPDGQVIPTEVPSAPAPVKSPKEFSVYDYLVDTKAVDPQRQYVIDRISDPERVLSSLADEQLDIIRGTSPIGRNAIENAERTAELRRQVSLVNKNRIEAADQVRKEIVSDQSINALGSAEDQQTGRVNRQLQRNEDLDQSQIAVMEEIAEEQDRRFGQGLESGEIAPGKEYGAPIDIVTQSLPDGPPDIQSEQRLGVAKEQDFVQQALAKTRPAYAEELTSEDLSALRGIDRQLKEIRSEDQPKFYEGRGIDLDRISNAPKIKTGTFLDNAIGNLPATVIAADEIARRGVKDIGDTARGIKNVVVENVPSNLPDLSRVPTSGTNTSATVQLSDGSAAGPLYPFKQLVRGLTGDESVDVVTPQQYDYQAGPITQSDLNKMNQVGITGTRIAGPSNVQSIRNNQTLTRQGPVPEVESPEQTFVKTQLEQRLDKLQEETTKLKAISENLERAGQLMTGGTRAVNTPRSTTFDNARAAAMVARAGIKPRITNQYYQKNISLPKTMRQAVDTGSRDSGRIIDTEPKGGGGRKVTAYNPDYQQLSTVGPYGIERANYPKADITKRPTEMPISPRTGKPTQSWSTRPGSSPEVAKQSMEISENIRKIYNSGRPDAQQLVEDYKRSLGWSPD